MGPAADRLLAGYRRPGDLQALGIAARGAGRALHAFLKGLETELKVKLTSRGDYALAVDGLALYQRVRPLEPAQRLDQLGLLGWRHELHGGPHHGGHGVAYAPQRPRTTQPRLHDRRGLQLRSVQANRRSEGTCRDFGYTHLIARHEERHLPRTLR